MQFRLCIKCKQTKGACEFAKYRYTTPQGKRSSRYESRCNSCNRMRRKKRHEINRAKEISMGITWKNENFVHCLEYSKLYRSSVEGKAKRAEIQRRRKSKLSICHLTQEQKQKIHEIYVAAQKLERLIQACPLFNDPFLGKKVHVDHIVPIAKGGTHIPENLQVLLASQNMRKGSKT